MGYSPKSVPKYTCECGLPHSTNGKLDLGSVVYLKSDGFNKDYVYCSQKCADKYASERSDV